MAAPSDAVRVGEITGLWSFVKQIDWTEPWLIGLNVFHIVCLILTFCTTRYFNLQIVYFLILLLLIYMAEYINEWGAENFRSFSRLQYFDSNGLFISVVYSIPLLINCLIIVSLWIYSTSQILIKVKRAQLRQRLKKDESNKQQDESIKQDGSKKDK